MLLGKRVTNTCLVIVTWPGEKILKTYDLRHAWAARVHTHPDYSHIDIAVAAEMMGHSEKIHKATYLRWTLKKI